MLAVPLALSVGTDEAGGQPGVDAAMAAAPIWVLIVVGALVPPLEALLWVTGLRWIFVGFALLAFRGVV